VNDAVTPYFPLGPGPGLLRSVKAIEATVPSEAFPAGVDGSHCWHPAAVVPHKVVTKGRQTLIQIFHFFATTF